MIDHQTFPGSSNIAAATYDDETQTLTVEFADGDEYTYGGVPQGIWSGMRTAPSAGSYFHRHIRKQYWGLRG